MKLKIAKGRLTRGGTLVLVGVCALVLVIIGVGALFLIKILGGGQEMQNAVDSGALDSTKLALVNPGYTPTNASPTYNDELALLANTGNNSAYNALFTGSALAATTDPPFALGNINSVWGQAMMCSLNLAAMEAEGTSATSAEFAPPGNANDLGDYHAQSVYKAAKNINNKVAAALTPSGGLPPQVLGNQFIQTSNNNSLKMVSVAQNDSVQLTPGAQIGYEGQPGSNQNRASNLSWTTTQFQNICENFDATENGTLATQISGMLTPISTTAVTTSSGTANYLNGYQNIAIPGIGGDATNNFYFVPLCPATKPHMISGFDFATTPPAIAAATPVNNSFCIKGTMTEQKSNKPLDFAAIALAGPLDRYGGLSMPHGFIKIENLAGFDISNTPLQDPHTSTVRNGIGLSAAEYATHQLLEARSGYQGATVNGDPISQNMGQLYGVLEDSSGNNVQDSNGYLYVDPSKVGDFPLASNPQTTTTTTSGNPPVTTTNNTPDDTCGGRLQSVSTSGNMAPGHLPANFQCTDIGNGPVQLPTTNASLAVNGNNQIVSNDNPTDPAINAWLQAYLQGANNDAQYFGSQNHPHIWSVDPNIVPRVAPSLNNYVQATEPSDSQGNPTWPWQNDHIWMYTGMQLYPAIDQQHLSRAASGQDPIVYGTDGTIWQYLQDYTSVPSGSTFWPVVAPQPANIVFDRLVQRVLEIQPSYGNGDFQTAKNQLQALLSDPSTATLGMGKDAFIFLDDTQTPPQMKVVVTNHMYDAASITPGNTSGPGQELNSWPWLQYQVKQLISHANYKYDAISGQIHLNDCLDGWGGNNPNGNVPGGLNSTMVYGASRDITTDPPLDAPPQGNYLENVAGDWGYTQPFENADSVNTSQPLLPMNHIFVQNKYNFCPGTGYQGQLGVLFLEQFIHHGQCAGAPNVPEGSDGLGLGMPYSGTARNITYYVNGLQPAGTMLSGLPEDYPCVVFPVGFSMGPQPASCQVQGQCPAGWNNPNGNGLVPAAQGTQNGGDPNCSHTGAC
jgi:hypothetical protein